MRVHKTDYRIWIFILIAISIIFYPLATGNPTQSSRVYAAQPFQTVPPFNATIQAPIGTSITLPTPLPTVGLQTP